MGVSICSGVTKSAALFRRISVITRPDALSTFRFTLAGNQNVGSVVDTDCPSTW